jgi:hypothetical protein
MTTQTTILIFALACAALLMAPAVTAQDPASTANWQGQDSEFGSIRAPYTNTMDGQRAAIEASIVIRKMYEDKDVRFFMFGFVVENTPLDVTFDHVVRADTGQELPCAKREGDATTGMKCFVDLKFMPPVGTEIKMSGTLGSKRAGSFRAGTIVLAFDYNWMKVQMSNGLEAQLYADTLINVQKPTNGSDRLSGAIGNKVPDIGLAGIAAAACVGVGLAAMRRRRK